MAATLTALYVCASVRVNECVCFMKHQSGHVTIPEIFFILDVLEKSHIQYTLCLVIVGANCEPNGVCGWPGRSPDLGG